MTLLTDNLLQYFAFTSGTAVDSTGTTDGTLVGSPSTGTIVGTAIVVNGSSQYININRNFRNFWELNASVGFWFKTVDTTAKTIFGSRGSGGYYAPEINFNSGGVDGKLFFGADTNVGGVKSIDWNYTDANLNDGNPHFIVVTKTGGKIADYTLYVDGVAKSITSGSDGFSHDDTGQYNTTKWDNNIFIGCTDNAGSPALYLSMTVDEWGIWDRTLSAGEVTTLYNGGSGLTYPFTPPVAAFSGIPLSGYSPLSVTFTDSSTNTPTSWSWKKDSGGGYTEFSTSQNPTQTFTVGTYNIKLTATNASGSDDEEKLNYVIVTALNYYDRNRDKASIMYPTHKYEKVEKIF